MFKLKCALVCVVLSGCASIKQNETPKHVYCSLVSGDFCEIDSYCDVAITGMDSSSWGGRLSCVDSLDIMLVQEWRRKIIVTVDGRTYSFRGFYKNIGVADILIDIN